MVTPQYSEGAGYWQLLTLDRRLLRRKSWLHATTTAEPGASYDGAMAFAAGVLRELEKGCFAKIVEPASGVVGAETTVRQKMCVLTSFGRPVHVHIERWCIVYLSSTSVNTECRIFEPAFRRSRYWVAFG